MKTLILTILVIFAANLQSQIISVSDYSKILLNGDEFPDNIVKRLESEGFDLMYQNSELTQINLTYTLKKNDPYFYNIIMQRIGSVRNVVLTFNNNTAEYTRLSSEIIKKMVKQPKSKNGDSRYTYYKDANNIYFGIFADQSTEDKTYQISIANFSAYKEYYLKSVLDE
jgi:hypothetical protein